MLNTCSNSFGKRPTLRDSYSPCRRMALYGWSLLCQAFGASPSDEEAVSAISIIWGLDKLQYCIHIHYRSPCWHELVKFNRYWLTRCKSMVSTFSNSMDQPGMVTNPARGQLNRNNESFPVLVRAEEFGLARRVRPSRPASACSHVGPISSSSALRDMAYFLVHSLTFGCFLRRKTSTPSCTGMFCRERKNSGLQGRERFASRSRCHGCCLGPPSRFG